MRTAISPKYAPRRRGAMGSDPRRGANFRRGGTRGASPGSLGPAPMKLVSARPFWPLRDGLPAAFPALAADVRCDVAVIGAGITGAFLAWHLAEAGFDTVVLDRREAAHGSTAASTSLLQYELDEPLHRLAGRFGDEFARRCYRRCRTALDDTAALVGRLGLDCGFARRASLLLARDAGQVAG